MKRFTKWKTIVIAVIFTLLVALQPVVTYACTGAGGHGGC